MNSGKSNKPKFFSASEQLRLNLQKSFTDLQCQCSGLFHHLSRLPLFDPKHYSLKFDLQNNLSNFQNHAKHALDAGISSFYAGPSSSGKDPVWARIESKRSQVAVVRQSGVAMSTEAIEERLAGVPVYALSNGAEEFVLVSGASTGKSLGLFCFKKEDAESLLQQIGSLDPGMRTGSKVVAVALNKVFQLKVNGVAFRLIPEYSQVKNALQEREKAGISDDGFPGVPVFQTQPLTTVTVDYQI